MNEFNEEYLFKGAQALYRLTVDGNNTQLASTAILYPSGSPNINSGSSSSIGSFEYNGNFENIPGTGLLPGGAEGAWGGHSNGRLPESALSPIGRGRHRLRHDAAEAFIKLDAAAKKDGINLLLTDSYRTFAQQVDLKRRKGKWAATPGRSNHGWGLAVDISVGGYTGKVHKWLTINARRSGFTQPVWARKNGSLPEPWHWEYIGKWRP